MDRSVVVSRMRCGWKSSVKLWSTWLSCNDQREKAQSLAEKDGHRSSTAYWDQEIAKGRATFTM